MAVYKAGGCLTEYTERCVEDLRCICRERGNNDVAIDGVAPYCLIIDKDFYKVNDFGDVGVNSTQVEAIWLKADCLPIKARSEIITGGYKYKVKGDPMDQCDGWIVAQLTAPCKCE